MQEKTNFKLGIIVLNWNGTEDTIECLNSLSEHTKEFQYKVFLIDNGSDYPIRDRIIENLYLPIEYIKNKKNLGFAGGNNVGLQRVLDLDIPFFLLLNNDTKLIDNSLFKMLQFIENNILIGAVGAVNYYYSSPEKIWHAGVKNNYMKGKGHSIKVFDESSSEPVYVDYVPGSSFLGRSDLLKIVGLLDSNYFAYFEENDWCLRIKKKGYKVVFLPNCRILHKIGNSTATISKFYLRTRNRLYFYSKNELLRRKIFRFFLQDFLKSIYLMSKSKTHRILYVKALYFAYKDFYNNNLGKGNLDKFITYYS